VPVKKGIYPYFFANIIPRLSFAGNYMLKRAEHGKMIAGKSEQADKVIYLRIHNINYL
jgi:hypothetical protein